jgi:putative protease
MPDKNKHQQFNNKSNVELMAPVGSFESLRAAINAGADSIFFGITQLNMRAKSANNFNFEDLHKIAETCHKAGVKTYLTLNTLLYDHDLRLAYKIIDEAKKAGIDAVIAADMAVILYANKVGQTVHISTQMSVSNIEMVRFYAQYSNMIVLARELTLPMVKKICDQIKEEDIRGTDGEQIKIEIFGHGAMCVAFSGRCHMSLLTDNSSAQRGACTQNCRRSYTITDTDSKTQLKIENNYVMSPTDLCTIGLLDELVDSGVATLKIEGRGRSPDYVDKVITCYREALDAIADGTYTKAKIEAWNKRLGTVYNRGMSGGFYMGKPFIEWSGAYGNKATQKREFVGLVTNYYPKIEVAEVKVTSNEISTDDAYIFTGESTGVLRGENPELWVDEQPVDVARKGDAVTFKVEQRVRAGDRFYKVIDNDSNE